MRAPEPLTLYVREALALGHPRPLIAQAARAAGWSEGETRAALDAWVDAGPLPPAPRPRAVVSARDAFRHGLMFLALLLIASNVIYLSFALVDAWLPDPLDSLSYGAEEGVRWAVAALAVSWPVWAWLSLSLAGEAERDPGQRRSAVGRWLTWGALFLAAATMIATAVATVAGFLGGELTPRFIAKAGCVLLVAGAILAFYGAGRDAETPA
jgi:hypothetical protein